MRTKRIVLWSVVGLALAAAAFYVVQRRPWVPQTELTLLRQAVLGPGTIIASVNATGNLTPQEEAQLYFRAGQGQTIAEVSASVGEAVAAGDVLARLDAEAATLAVLEAEQALRAAELQLEALQAPARPEDIAVAEANLAVAQRQVTAAANSGTSAEAVEIARLNLVLAQSALNQTYALMERLEAQGRWAEKNALQATADRQVEEAQVADLRYHAAQEAPAAAPVASAQAGVEQAEAALERLRRGPAAEDVAIAELRVRQAAASLERAQEDLVRLSVLAPFDGVVAAVNVRAGEPATSALPAVVLARVAEFGLDVSVDEVDIARVHPGQAVSITLDALPDLVLPGSVARIAPTATVNAGVVSYAVHITLPAATAGQARAGMTGTAAIVVDEVRDVLVVPNWAIRRDRETGASFVGVLRGDRLEDVPVTLGLRDETHSQVLSGLRAGETVAVSAERNDVFNLFGGGGQ